MQQHKRIDFVAAPQETHWVGDGFLVHNFIPSVEGLSQRAMDPFLLLDYNAKMMVKPGVRPRGVDVHPHRGFETVTIAYEGEVTHDDGAGHNGTIRRGDVQWMTAASGVLHKEFHSKEFTRRGGLFQMVQLWVNLPSERKMMKPTYQALPQSGLGKVQLPGGAGVVEVIAGEYRGVAGPAATQSPVFLMNARLNKGGSADFSFPASYNTALLAVSGRISVDRVEVAQDHILKFGNEGSDFSVQALEPDTVALIMSGEPLREPIVSYGPFVMNTREQIMQAIDDMETGAFGRL